MLDVSNIVAPTSGTEAGRYIAFAADARRASLRRAAACCLAALLLCVPGARGEGPATRGILQWKSGAVITPQQDAEALADAVDDIMRTGARHVVVQFHRPVTSVERNQLAAGGLELLSYVGDNAFFAAVNAGRLGRAGLGKDAGLGTFVRHGRLTLQAGKMPTLPVGVLRCLLPIERNWKLHPDLVTGDVPEWAVVSRSKGTKARRDEGARSVRPVCRTSQTIVAAYVLFHADVALTTEAVPTCWRHGAWIRSVLESINGLVIELPAGNIDALADEDGVQWIEPPLPKFSEVNDDNRARTGADIVQEPPYELDGSGVGVLVYDGGYGWSQHADFGGRHTVRDTSVLSEHATHVAGTVGGAGTVSGGTFRGMAPAVTMESYGFEQEGGLHEGFLYTDPGDIEADYSEAIDTYGVDIANNSIGTNTSVNGFPCEWEGNYGVTSALIDTIVRGDASNPLFSQPFRVVWANGNERQVDRCLGVEGFEIPYHSTAPPACAKNHITVGALNSNDDSVTSFTSFGPADDGRLKPDVSAPGCQSNDDHGVRSCANDGGYMTKCGTSMACPTVCGLAALLIQDYRVQYPEQPDPRNSTLKILLAHTAEDIEEAGPDYKTGYGSVRIQPAVDLLRSGYFLEDEVSYEDVYSATVIVTPLDAELKVTLAWDDVPGTPDVDPALVNDLDLRVFDESNEQHFPWTLDPDNPSVPAVRTQPDHVNNIEQVVIEFPAPGVYRVEVFGFNVPSGPQPFSLSATPYLVRCTSAGTMVLDRPKYTCQTEATLRVVDCDLNTDPDIIDTVTVTIESDSEPDGEDVLLTETSPDSAALVGTIPLDTTNAGGVLLVAPGDTVTATYIDADDGQGGQNVVVTALATVDCEPPVISNVQWDDPHPRDVTITFDTDEPAQVTVRYGLACAELSESKAVAGYRTAHSVQLTGLDDTTTYFFAVDAVDEAGNPATDDNGGSCYSFDTPEIPDFFTEQFASDNDLDYLNLVFTLDARNACQGFTPNDAVDLYTYTGCLYPIVELPTDPAGGTVLSLFEDNYVQVDLTEATVSLYGVEYSTFYVGSNGYITFVEGDITWTETLEQHFALPRISALFDDFTPQNGGPVSWQQLDDRVVVTWEDVPEYNTSNSNTFQIEMFFDGRIAISYLAIAAIDGIAGLSDGTGLSPDFSETDLSAMAICGPYPPLAYGCDVITDYNEPVTIVLEAVDDGLPDPPGALTYIVVSLPEHGSLSDPDAGEITEGDLPYTLVDGGDQVIYDPKPYCGGADSFTFKANDGGEPPEGGDSNVATVSITVGGPQPTYIFSLDDDPGWETEGDWAFGQPTGGGGQHGAPDPTSGHTGTNVYGYNLEGDYPNNLPETHLTSHPVDCTGLINVSLRFWRWLGVEGPDDDHAYVRVSTDGDNWTDIWQNGGQVSDGVWAHQEYNISALADDQPEVYVRWTMGETDESWQFCGWNIDDIEIWGETPVSGLGDVNCDFVVDFWDINPFVMALTDPDMYEATYPDCPFENRDINEDGEFDFEDINPFVALLTGGE